jgi:hypothetical protein
MIIENELIAVRSIHTSAEYKQGSTDTAQTIADAIKARGM